MSDEPIFSQYQSSISRHYIVLTLQVTEQQKVAIVIAMPEILPDLVSRLEIKQKIRLTMTKLQINSKTSTTFGGIFLRAELGGKAAELRFKAPKVRFNVLRTVQGNFVAVQCHLNDNYPKQKK